MERTISAMIGKGSVNHNTRAFTAKNVDKNRSTDNVEFCQEDIKQVYHKLFDEARERYNAKQKRKDRMIDNYYEKIRRGKQEKLFHEVIFATVYKGNIIKNLIMDCQSYTKYRPNETTGGIFVSWRRKEELPTGA